MNFIRIFHYATPRYPVMLVTSLFIRDRATLTTNCAAIDMFLRENPDRPSAVSAWIQNSQRQSEDTKY